MDSHVLVHQIMMAAKIPAMYAHHAPRFELPYDPAPSFVVAFKRSRIYSPAFIGAYFDGLDSEMQLGSVCLCQHIAVWTRKSR